jgi:hypothetical protein
VTAADGKPHKDYSVFRQPTGRRTVVVVNHDRSRELAATVRIDGYSGPLSLASPEQPERIPASNTIIVPPRSAVVMFQEN